jgi:hypothetical protein
MLIYATTAIAFFWFVFSFFLNSGSPSELCFYVGMALILMVLWGLSYRNFLLTFVIRVLLCAIWRESSGSIAPMIAIWLATYSLTYVGFI